MPGDLPVLVIDGTAFADLAGLAAQVSSFLDGCTWTGNLDALDDILRGGFGTPEGGFVLRWDHSEQSRERLGHDAMAQRIESLLETCHPDNILSMSEELDAARRGDGPTLFDVLVEIIREHGPGGVEFEDGVHLDLR